MGGIPRIGRDFDVRKEMAEPAPSPEVLGVIPSSTLDPEPQPAAWTGPSGESLTMTEAPPPWETSAGYDESDARHYVSAPSNVTLRWINPRLLDQMGWRYWQAVSPSDSRFTVKVKEMVFPDGTIRRGGQGGDILGWMLTSWVESNRRRLGDETRKRTEAAVNRQEQLKDEFRRGRYGPNIRLEEARHPSHTIADGKSMSRD